jgi:hypothetical protein
MQPKTKEKLKEIGKGLGVLVIVGTIINGPDLMKAAKIDYSLGNFLRMSTFVERIGDIGKEIIREITSFGCGPSHLIVKKQKYEPLVEDAANKFLTGSYKGNKALIIADILGESELNEYANSRAGARGLMQLLPSTAADELRSGIAIERSKIGNKHYENYIYETLRGKGIDLLDPKTNIELGCRILMNYCRELGGDIKLGLAAYNCGLPLVKKICELRDKHDNLTKRYAYEDIKQRLPSETKQYVPKVLAYYKLFRDFYWPVSNYRAIGSNFGMRFHPILHEWREHTGDDVRASKYEPVYSPVEGVVQLARWKGGYGNCVEIKDKDGLPYFVRYGHLDTIFVREGATIKRGQMIGRIGSTGLSTGAHLHIEIIVQGYYQDPGLFLDGKEEYFIEGVDKIVKKDVEIAMLKAPISEVNKSRQYYKQ